MKKKTRDFIIFYAEDIVKKWMDSFVLKTEVKIVRIKTKIDKEELKLKKINLK